jgi:tRNA modification GTPase
MRRASEQIAEADLLLWVQDAGASFRPPDEARVPPETRVIHVRNKIDLYPDALDDLPGADRRVDISALTGEGLDDLRGSIRAAAGLDGPPQEGAFLARRRHLDALERGLAALESAAAILDERMAPELAAADLRQAQDALSEITGSFTPDDLLGRIFSSFCIGK